MILTVVPMVTGPRPKVRQGAALNHEYLELVLADDAILVTVGEPQDLADDFLLAVVGDLLVRVVKETVCP